MEKQEENSRREKIDLKRFYKDFDYSNKMGDERHRILTLHLYLEHFINELVKNKSGDFPEKVIQESLTIPVKCQILFDWNIITKEQRKIIEILAKTRNDMIHNLVIDTDKLGKRLKTTDFEFIKDENGKKVKVFEYLAPYSQLISASAVIISILYAQLEKMKGNGVKQFIQLKIEKQGDKYKHIIGFFERNQPV